MLTRITLTILLTTSLFQDASSQVDIVDIELGLTMEQVQDQETATLIRATPDSLFYKTQIAGLDATLIYVMYKGFMLEAIGVFDRGHNSPDPYIQDFRTINDALMEKLGSGIFGPHKNGEEPDSWHSPVSIDHLNEMKTHYQDSLGLAVQSGHAQYLNGWMDEERMVELRLSGGRRAKRSVPVSMYKGEGFLSDVFGCLPWPSHFSRRIKGRHAGDERAEEAEVKILKGTYSSR